MLVSSSNNKIDKTIYQKDCIEIPTKISKSSSYDKDLETIFINREYSLHSNNFNPNKTEKLNSYHVQRETRCDLRSSPTLLRQTVKQNGLN